MGRPDPALLSAVVAHLRRHFPSMCRHWFDDIEALDLTGGNLRLLVREPVQLKYLQRCCTKPFSEAAQEVTGRLLAVSFVGEGEAEEEAHAGESPRPMASEHRGTMSSMTDDEVLISPDYRFDTFVVGPGNRLAYAAASAVAKQTGRAYNPFFIHAGVGLGKTHLLHAICQEAMRIDPKVRIHYVHCHGFTNQFLEAVQAGQMNEFRYRFRNVDILVIDDIHDLSQRERTQEEFFHTFNALYQAGKQIVLSSDAPPKEIPHLEERLTSRFNCGLVARIDRPCYETRVAIVQSKARLRNLALPDEVASYIAAKIDSNIRELEGAITKIQSVAALDGAAIDLEFAKTALNDDAGSGHPHQPTIQDIIGAVTGYYDVKLTDLLSKRRHKSVALPRQVCMWLARKHTRYSLEEIGGYFGGRDHTTVMHAIKAINKKRSHDTSLDNDVSRLEQQIITKLLV